MNTKVRLLNVFLRLHQQSKNSSAGLRIPQCKRLPNINPQTSANTPFLRVAQAVYLEYEKRRKERGKIDFNDLLKEAEEIVKKTKGHCLVGEGEKKGSA